MTIKKIKCAILGILILLSVGFAYANPITIYNTKADCNLLKESNTVVVVWASWCHNSKDYMPKYTQVSNDPKFANWTFYKIKDNWPLPIPVCHVLITGVPSTFKNNMSTKEGPNDTVNDIIKFLNSKK